MPNSPASPRKPRPPFRPRTQEPPAGYVAVGRIAGRWGVQGEFKVDPLTDFPGRFQPGSRLWLMGAPYTVVAAQEHQGRLLVRFAGIDTPEQAKPFAGKLLVVPEKDLPQLPADTYYRYQLIGMDVASTDGEPLGRVAELLETVANDVLVVRGPLGEFLLPAIGDVVRAIDLPGRRITIAVIEGLLPEAQPAAAPRRGKRRSAKPGGPHSS